MKKCKVCNESKEIDQFYKAKDTKDKLQGQCKLCKSIADKKYKEKYNRDPLVRAKIREYQRERYNKNPECKRKKKEYHESYYKRSEVKNRVREYLIKYRYKITLEERNKIFNIQNGCCAICNKHQSLFERDLDIDHSHKTGKVRGLLCRHHNLLIGNAQENVEILKRAIDYLNKYIDE